MMLHIVLDYSSTTEDADHIRNTLPLVRVDESRWRRFKILTGFYPGSLEDARLALRDIPHVLSVDPDRMLRKI